MATKTTSQMTEQEIRRMMMEEDQRRREEQKAQAQAQARLSSASQFLDEKTILELQDQERRRNQEQQRRDEMLRQGQPAEQRTAQPQGLSPEAQLSQAFDQERANYERETQNRLNSQQAMFDQRYAALQQDQQRRQADYDRQIRDLQDQIKNSQAEYASAISASQSQSAAKQKEYDASIKALQDQLASARTGYETQIKEQAAANQAAQDTALTQQKASLEAAFKGQQEAERNSAKNQALDALRKQYESVGAYTAKNADQINQQAQDELKSTYDSKLLAARQAQEKQDLALAQQAESVGRSYDKQREQTNKVYDRNVSEADRRALARGMQRSSYNAQTMANIDSERARALQDINEQQVNAEGNIAAKRTQLVNQLADTERSYADSMAADIRARARELESQEYDRGFQNAQLRSQLASDLYNKQYGQTRDEVSDTQWGRSFEEGQRQFNAGQELTRSENALNRAFQTSEREAQQGYQSVENALNRAFTTSEREATQKYQSGENALNRAFQTSEREAQQAYNTSEREAQQQYQSEQAEKQQAFQAEQAALNREQDQAQFEVRQAFAEKQWEGQQEQIKEEFDYKQKSDAQQIAFEFLLTKIKNGDPVTDEMLKAAGLTTQEGQALVAEANAEGSPVITWRQAADRAAKDAGYTGRNDPRIKEDAKSGKITDKDWLASIGV